MTQYWPATFVQGLSESTKAVQDAFEQVSSIYLIMEGFVLGLALLIAFDAANINSDERVRDHATMFAYGVSVLRVLGNLAVEGLVLGALATVMGVVLGYSLLLWMLLAPMPESYPDMVINLAVNIPQAAAVLAAGVFGVTHTSGRPRDARGRRTHVPRVAASYLLS